MKKKWLIIIPIVLLIVIILLLFKTSFFGPSVGFSDKKQLTGVVEKYLIKKYGDHKYKITDIRYDYKMNSFFDYSNPVGYFVDCNSNIVNHFYVYVEGVLPDKITVDHDSLIDEYLYPDLDGYDRKQKEKSIAPVDKIKEELLNGLMGIDSDVETINNIEVYLKYPINLGKIPTEDDLKNNMDYYEITDFTYTRKTKVTGETDYINKIQEYLNNNYGRNWKVTINPNGSISCS